MGLAVQISAAPRRSMQPFSKEGQASCLWAGGEQARPTRAQGRLLLRRERVVLRLAVSQKIRTRYC